MRLHGLYFRENVGELHTFVLIDIPRLCPAFRLFLVRAEVTLSMRMKGWR